MNSVETILEYFRSFPGLVICGTVSLVMLDGQQAAAPKQPCHHKGTQPLPNTYNDSVPIQSFHFSLSVQ